MPKTARTGTDRKPETLDAGTPLPAPRSWFYWSCVVGAMAAAVVVIVASLVCAALTGSMAPASVRGGSIGISPTAAADENR
ncbi:MAG TPA: hypothetical protein VGX23_03675 [Actinocrinis sp.]|nr:hypothetical protein [Actinocrinis sp.]